MAVNLKGEIGCQQKGSNRLSTEMMKYAVNRKDEIGCQQKR